MTPIPDQHVDFSKMMGALASGQVWQYERSTGKRLGEISKHTFHSLQAPLDFPPVGAAIVPGDRVALAVDPNVPSIVRVLDGVLLALAETDASGIDIVLWDEAADETVAALQHRVGESIRVVRHESSQRGSLRYLGADKSADPIYLNRRLVDADFVLPIAVGRPLDALLACDLTGIFPSFADTNSRLRQYRATHDAETTSRGVAAHGVFGDADEPSWLLGIQLMICASANDDGELGQVTAGTPDAIRKQLAPSQRMPDEFPPPAPLVIASLDGDSQQQTWCNAARAIAAAGRYCQPGGTIVLWSEIDEVPSAALMGLVDSEQSGDERKSFADQPVSIELVPEDEDFPAWDESTATARTLRRIAAEHRVLIHSRVDEENIESMGLASVDSGEELTRLSGSFNECGVLRAAQFAGTTFDAPAITP